MAEGHESTGKKQGFVTFSTDRENAVSIFLLFTLSLRLSGARERKKVELKRKV